MPYTLDQCEDTGRIANFAVAGGLEEGDFAGIYFNDSDVFKVVEGASYALAARPDAELEVRLDRLIEKIAAAQEGAATSTPSAGFEVELPNLRAR